MTPDAECTLIITGLDTNPGSGTGESITARFVYVGEQEAVIKAFPEIPFFGSSEVKLTLDTLRATALLECQDVITFGVIRFTEGTDATSFSASDAELTLQRGVDYACGADLQLSFSLPCSVGIN